MLRTPTSSSRRPARAAQGRATARRRRPKTIHVTETLRGRELIVHVSGAASGKVRHHGLRRPAARPNRSLRRYDGHAPADQGRLTVTFRLGPRTAAQALIRVSAKLDHELAVTSTLRRPAAHERFRGETALRPGRRLPRIAGVHQRLGPRGVGREFEPDHRLGVTVIEEQARVRIECRDLLHLLVGGSRSKTFQFSAILSARTDFGIATMPRWISQ